MESLALDEIDRRIVAHLEKNARITWRELGENVHLSATSVGERVRRLEGGGVLLGYRAVVDPGAVGRGFRAVVEISLRPETVPEAFDALLAAHAGVTFAAYVSGAADYAVLLDCSGPADLDAFARVCKANGAASTESRVVLRPVVG